MLLGEHEKYHTLGPKDVGIDPDKKAAMTIDVLRTTNHTGEQLHIQVPVYGTETREEVNSRLNFAYSLIQDRMEAENKAIAWRNARQDTIRRADEASRRNKERLAKQMSNLDKHRKKQRWTEEQWVIERTKLMDAFKQADEINQSKIAHAAEELETGKEIPYAGPTEEYVNMGEPIADPDEVPALEASPN